MTDRSGRVYVPLLVIGAAGFFSPAVAVSQGGAATGSFVIHHLTSDRANFFANAAIDSTGNVAVTWRGTSGSDWVARVSRSTDHGNTWSQPVVWGSGSVTSSPWINLRGAQADVLWYGVTTPGVSSHLLLTRGAANGRALQQVVVVPQISDGGSRTEANTDYANFAYLRDGRVIVVWTESNSVYVSVELPTQR